MATQYERLKTQITKKRGRTPLPKEEKARRVDAQRKEARRRNEARRRASLVLTHKYEEEFQKYFAEEYKALSKDTRFASK